MRNQEYIIQRQWKHWVYKTHEEAMDHGCREGMHMYGKPQEKELLMLSMPD
jgi:hypothetical protein